jgi:hypothetical protein
MAQAICLELGVTAVLFLISLRLAFYLNRQRPALSALDEEEARILKEIHELDAQI